MGEEVIEFGEEELDGPEPGVVFSGGQVRALAAADLVVEDYGDGVGAGEVGEGQEVVVRDSWTTVEDDEWGGAGGMGALDLVPGFGVCVDVWDAEENCSFGNWRGGRGGHGGRDECGEWRKGGQREEVIGETEKARGIIFAVIQDAVIGGLRKVGLDMEKVI